MPTMCSLVARGWFITDVESHLADPMNQLQFLGELGKPQGVVDAFVKAGLVTDPHLEKHLRNDWIGNEWWPHANKEAILRWGFITLIDKARQYGVKPCIRWICIGDKFQCLISRTPTEMLMVLLTPPVPLQGLYVPATEADDSWVVGSAADIQEILARTEWVGNGSKPGETDVQLLDAQSGVWCAPVFSDKRPS